MELEYSQGIGKGSGSGKTQLLLLMLLESIQDGKDEKLEEDEEQDSLG